MGVGEGRALGWEGKKRTNKGKLFLEKAKSIDTLSRNEILF